MSHSIRQSSRVTASTRPERRLCSNPFQRGSRKTNKSRQTLVSSTSRATDSALLFVAIVLIVKATCIRTFYRGCCEILASFQNIVTMVGDAPELMDVDSDETPIMQQAQVMLDQLGRCVLPDQTALDFFDIAVAGTERRKCSQDICHQGFVAFHISSCGIRLCSKGAVSCLWAKGHEYVIRCRVASLRICSLSGNFV